MVPPSSRPVPSPDVDAERSREVRFAPHPDDMAEVVAAFEAAHRGELLSVEESAAYIHWLETGEGPCPWPSDSHG